MIINVARTSIRSLLQIVFVAGLVRGEEDTSPTDNFSHTTNSTTSFIPELTTDGSQQSNLLSALNEWERIDGCPDYNSFNDTSEKLSEAQLSKITCICGPSDISVPNMLAASGISINCIYGSSLEDFHRTLHLVIAANKTVHKVTMSGVILNENSTLSLTSIFTDAYHDKEIPLISLEVKNCHGGIPLQISPKNESNVENEIALPNLEYLTLEDCELQEMPQELVQNSYSLKDLSLANNKIKIIMNADIGKAAKTIEYLNLESNLLNYVEEGALSQMSSLKLLRLGEHNYASSKIIQEIGQIPELEHLDMTRIDGVDDEKQFKSDSLKKLILTGCNLKSINASNFGELHTLEELDLRVNLIEKIHADSFVGLHNLKRLNMAGNFLRNLNDTNTWNGLVNLKQLDLGWNDFVRLNATTFTTLSKGVEELDLRHNEKLKMIEADTFANFTSLVFLNLSHSALSEIKNETFPTKNLKVLDLSFNNISSIASDAFDEIKEHIEHLNISGNQLNTIDKRIFDGISQLKEIDLSENPWICDESMKKIRDLINEKYKTAAVNSMEFELKNEKKTLCHRPYAKKGMSIFELDDEDFAYNKTLDVTEPPSLFTTTAMNGDENAENSTFNWQLATFIVGEEENTLSAVDEDAGKPTYDINSVRYGQRTYKKMSNTWLSAVIVVILIILTAVCIILIVRRKKTGMVTNEIACTATTTQL